MDLQMKKINLISMLEIFFLLYFLGCQSTESKMDPGICVHYLGHASFVLQFDNGITILTDYGTSHAWDLDSPIYEMGDLQPNVVTYSHTAHIDHYRGSAPEHIDHVLMQGEGLQLQGITIEPIPTSELSLEEKDNTSYLISYRGFRILHLGDAQANIKKIHEGENRDHVKAIFPETIDLLLMTIGGRTDIIEQAVSFIDLLQPRMVVPMHYWKKEDKQRFLSHLKTQNTNTDEKYRIEEIQGAQYRFSGIENRETCIKVISLEPAPYSQPDGTR